MNRGKWVWWARVAFQGLRRAAFRSSREEARQTDAELLGVLGFTERMMRRYALVTDATLLAAEAVSGSESGSIVPSMKGPKARWANPSSNGRSR
jgi:hypothetical protein